MIVLFSLFLMNSHRIRGRDLRERPLSLVTANSSCLANKIRIKDGTALRSQRLHSGDSLLAHTQVRRGLLPIVALDIGIPSAYNSCPQPVGCLRKRFISGTKFQL